MFVTLYDFFFNWLFGESTVTFLSVQGQEFATILLCVITIVALVWLAILPIKAILRLIIR